MGGVSTSEGFTRLKEGTQMTIKAKIIGYAAVGPRGPLDLWFPIGGEYPPNGLLVYGDSIWVFSTRSKARAAMRRSKKWATKNNYSWAKDIIKIQSVRFAGIK